MKTIEELEEEIAYQEKNQKTGYSAFRDKYIARLKEELQEKLTT